MKLPLAAGAIALACAAVHAEDAPAAGAAPTGDPCAPSGAPLRTLALPDLTVTAVEHFTEPVDHCKLTARLDREINFSLWLPDTWNGKFLLGGGGGYVGSIQNQALPRALEGGYATAGTDTGHQGAGTDASWGLHNLERIVNYGHLAMHRVAQVSKYVTARHYAAPPERSYFAGCSGGGRQGLIFAQRYPSEFDAIVSGAPAFDFAGLAAAFLNATMHVYPDIDDLSAPVLTRDDLTLLGEAVLARCDARDGLADGILNDPRDCDFDPGTLDLPPAKIAAIRAIYAGPRTGDGPVYPGWPFGGEDQPGSWDTWLTGAQEEAPDGLPSRAFAFGVGFMRYMVEHDPDWTYEGMDFLGYRARTATAAAAINATDPDLDAFREAGGKLLLYHGWADAALSALATVGYVDEVYARDPSARADMRLFMLPGVLHCQGGPGPWMVDYLGALERWDADGVAPDTLPAAFEDGNGARPLCAHPARVEYIGGSGKNPADFECR